jgi:hypothetical protein
MKQLETRFELIVEALQSARSYAEVMNDEVVEKIDLALGLCCKIDAMPLPTKTNMVEWVKEYRNRTGSRLAEAVEAHRAAKRLLGLGE